MKTLNILKNNSLTVYGGNDSFICESQHFHKETQFTLIIDGEGTLYLNRYKQRFKPGDTFLIRAYEPHRFKSDTARSECQKCIKAIHILFDSEKHFKESVEFIEMESIRDFLLEKENYQIITPPDTARLIRRRFRDVQETSGLSRLLTFFDLLSIVSLSPSEQWKSLSSGLQRGRPANVADERIQKVFAYAKENYAQKISLQEIAAVANLAPEYFCKYFKGKVMLTWGTFIDKVRVHEVCKRLIANNNSISAAAYSCGFNSLTTFYRTFKRVTGRSPKEYIELYINKQQQAIKQTTTGNLRVCLKNDSAR